MLKKILLIFLIVVVLIAAATFVINRFFLPSKIKSLIVEGLSKQTQKSVKLDSVEFSFFRGLIIKNLSIFDQDKTYILVKDADCSFLPLPFLKKEIIVPWINIRQAELYLERRADNTFNIAGLFNKQGQEKSGKSGFNLIVKKISIRNSTIFFIDDTLRPAFKKTIDNINANIYLALPAQVKFNFKWQISSKEIQLFNLAGIYNILNQELGAKMAVKGLQLSEFSGYLRRAGLIFNSGKADIAAQARQKGKILNLKLEALVNSLGVAKDRVEMLLDSKINADINYNLESKDLKFSGQCSVDNGAMSGAEFVGKLSNINANLQFDSNGISSNNIKANALNLPIEAKFKLENFNQPKFLVRVSCSPELENIPEWLNSAAKYKLPLKLKGSSRLNITARSGAAAGLPLLVNGALEFNGALINADMLHKPITDASGKISFTQDSLEWKPLKFIYDGINYSSAGILTNFKTPDIVLTLKSEDLFIDSEFIIKKQLININRCNLRYLDSECNFSGTADTSRKNNPGVDINAKARISLDNLNKFFAKQLQKAKPLGFVDTEFSLNGNINNIKSCLISGDAKGKNLSLFGLKADDFVMEYYQKEGFGELDLINMALYSGFLQGSVNLDYNIEGAPFSLKAKAGKIDIAKLKNDTGLKKNDLAGLLSGELALDGAFDDSAKLNGAGKINITNGRLWQLNLFQGMGKLIFARDFANIDFNEASCFFIVGNKMVKTDNIMMNSDLAQLSGSCRVGFDSSLDASINVQVSDKMIPVTGTFKDIATAIIGSAGKFGVITITGTLQNPKYQFKTAVVDIMKSVTDAIFR